MTHAGQPLTDEELRRQLDRRVSVAPLTPDDRTNLIRAARLRLSEPVRPFLGPRALGWVVGIAAVVVLALVSLPLVLGPLGLTQQPTSSPSAGPSASPSLPLSLDSALVLSETHVPDGAELWSYAPDPYFSAMQKVFGPGSYDPPPSGATQDSLMWVVAFKVGSGLTTVYIDLLTGAWLGNRDTPGPPPQQHRSDIAFYEPIIHISNGTTLTLDVLINARTAITAQPQRESTIDPRNFGESPWNIVVKTQSGRQLIAFDERPEDNYYTTGDDPRSATGDAMRADLSCGRLDVWVGVPLIGPMPPASFPAHDCDP